MIGPSEIANRREVEKRVIGWGEGRDDKSAAGVGTLKSAHNPTTKPPTVTQTPAPKPVRPTPKIQVTVTHSPYTYPAVILPLLTAYYEPFFKKTSCGDIGEEIRVDCASVGMSNGGGGEDCTLLSSIVNSLFMTLSVTGGLKSRGWFGAVTFGIDVGEEEIVIDPDDCTDLDCYTVIFGNVDNCGSVVDDYEIVSFHTHANLGGRFGKRLVSQAEILRGIEMCLEEVKIVKSFQRKFVEGN